MWLNHFFAEENIDFEKRCRTRVIVGIFIAILGGAALVLAVLNQGQMPILYPKAGAQEFLSEFYFTTGAALIGAGAVTALKNIRYLRSPEKRKKREVEETDERNRLLGLRCWAYSGYAMFLLLYIGVLAAGFVSMTALKVLLAVIALYALLLLIFRLMLQRCM